MNNLHAAKKQDGYVVKEGTRIANHKSLVGIRYVAESLRGDVVKSTWLEQVDEDGTIYKLNTRIREGLTPSGKFFSKVDRTLIVSNVGAETLAEVAASGSHLMHTSIGVVCMTCLTSDHVVEDKDGMGGSTCTRCGSWIARYKGE